MLVGPSKTGKTQWARSLGRHIFFREQYNMDLYDRDASYVIFDDLQMERVHGLKCWLGSMGQFSDVDKYREKTALVWGPKKCCIILCNPGVDWRYNKIWKDETEWYETNVEVIEITRNMF